MARQRGIDISAWQGTVDFAKVKADGVQFVILHEGYSQAIDKKFLEYARGCQKAGIPILGVYHFSYALNEEQARQEAVSCINNMKKAGLGKDVIVFFDLEYDSVDYAKAQGVIIEKNECIAHTKAFCEQVTSLGYKAGIYANVDYYNRMYSKDLIDEYVFWLASWSNSQSPTIDCMIWQYSNKGTINGINEDVDMDFFYGEVKTNILTPKSIDTIAQEVLGGMWGNGDEREKALIEAGYDYSTVQEKVNELLSGPSTLKSIDEIAQEVLDGEWGNGQDREQALTEAGYDYSEVQEKVNELLSTLKSIDEVAHEVLDRLTKAGYDTKAVQKIVNKILSALETG
nr:MAG TPA: hypothetical protein [Herelleviridae sp.]